MIYSHQYCPVYLLHVISCIFSSHKPSEMGQQMLTWTTSFKVVVKKGFFSLFYKVINLVTVLVEATTVAQLSEAEMVLVP